jgi:hypothetical protein
MEIQNQNRWEILLFVGKLDLRNSEACFRQALKDAESMYGRDSPEVGLCLIELSDFLERQGQQVEADLLSKRYRSILRTFARKVSLDRCMPGFWS